MTTRKTADRLRSATHIVVRANEAGECEFMNDVNRGWTKHAYLAIRLSPDDAEKIAARVGGVAALHPSVEEKVTIYADPNEN